MCEAMKESNLVFEYTMNTIRLSVEKIAEYMSQSLEQMTRQHFQAPY